MKKIVMTVCFFHFLFFLWLTNHSSSPISPLKPIRVNTIALVEPIPSSISSEPMSEPEIKPNLEPEVKTKTELPKKPKTKTPASPKKDKPKKALPPPKPTPPVAQKKPDDKKQKILADAKEKIRQLAKSCANISVQNSLASLTIQTKGLATNERNYVDKLVSYLQGTLVLPEKGALSLLLTLKRNGSVSKIEFKTVKSETNRKYVNKELTKLIFPTFGSDFEGEQEHLFELTLSSE